jgi:transcriptional regulator with XRE-family HTH domain
MASPAVRRRRLAAQLRAIRESQRTTADRVARRLGWSTSKLTRYELAQRRLRVPDVARLLDCYQVTGDRRDHLLQLAREAAGEGWWEESGIGLPADVQHYIGLEDEATTICLRHGDVVPGLLQTAAYARHLIASYGAIEPIAPGMIERLVRVRMRRQEVLTRELPARLSVVLDEAILRRRVGDDRVMRDQLMHLAELGDRPNISLRILPLGAHHMVVGPAFAVFEFGSAEGGALPDVVASEQLKTILIEESEQQAHLHSLVFRALEGASLSPAESTDLILEIAESAWSYSGRAGRSARRTGT